MNTLGTPELKFEAIGGQLDKNRHFYINRDIDTALLSDLLNTRGFATIIGPRQIGKTSLCLSVAKELKVKEQHTVFIDMGRLFGHQHNDQTKNRQGWFSTLFYKIALEAIGATVAEVNTWIDLQPSGLGTQALSDFLGDFIRPKVNGTINLIFDEIDITRNFQSHTDDFFYGLSCVANDRNTLDISILLIGVTPVYELLKISVQSVVNNCQNLALNDFSETELIEGFATKIEACEEQQLLIARQVYNETGGQPYLTNVLFDDIRRHNITEPEAIHQLALDFVAGIQLRTAPNAHFLYHEESLERIHHSGVSDALDLHLLLRKNTKPLAGLNTTEKKASDILLRLGMAFINNSQHLQTKCGIYQYYMDEDWVDDRLKNMGHQLVANAQYQRKANKEDLTNICIINIGGMINMELQANGDIGEPTDLYDYVANVPELHELANFETVPLFIKDSSTVDPTDWAKVAKAIYSRKNRGFSGFIITGGTDTLPSIASALAFSLGPGLRFPVVCTGSQVARHIWHGDARINLIRACKLATLGKALPEVVILSNDNALRAVRTEKKDDFRFDVFHSPTLKPVVEIAAELSVGSHVRKQEKSRFSLACETDFETEIFKVEFYPGLRAEYILATIQANNIKGLIIETPGIGVLPMEGGFSMEPVLDECKLRNIPLLLLSQYPTQAGMAANYQPAQASLREGVIPAGNMSPTAATVKFMWLLPQVQERITEGELKESEKIQWLHNEMSADYVGELDEPSE